MEELDRFRSRVNEAVERPIVSKGTPPPREIKCINFYLRDRTFVDLDLLQKSIHFFAAFCTEKELNTIVRRLKRFGIDRLYLLHQLSYLLPLENYFREECRMLATEFCEKRIFFFIKTSPELLRSVLIESKEMDHILDVLILTQKEGLEWPDIMEHAVHLGCKPRTVYRMLDKLQSLESSRNIITIIFDYLVGQKFIDSNEELVDKESNTIIGKFMKLLERQNIKVIISPKIGFLFPKQDASKSSRMNCASLVVFLYLNGIFGLTHVCKFNSLTLILMLVNIIEHKTDNKTETDKLDNILSNHIMNFESGDDCTIFKLLKYVKNISVISGICQRSLPAHIQLEAIRDLTRRFSFPDKTYSPEINAIFNRLILSKPELRLEAINFISLFAVQCSRNGTQEIDFFLKIYGLHSFWIRSDEYSQRQVAYSFALHCILHEHSLIEYSEIAQMLILFNLELEKDEDLLMLSLDLPQIYEIDFKKYLDSSLVQILLPFFNRNLDQQVLRKVVDCLLYEVDLKVLTVFCSVNGVNFSNLYEALGRFSQFEVQDLLLQIVNKSYAQGEKLKLRHFKTFIYENCFTAYLKSTDKSLILCTLDSIDEMDFLLDDMVPLLYFPDLDIRLKTMEMFYKSGKSIERICLETINQFLGTQIQLPPVPSWLIGRVFANDLALEKRSHLLSFIFNIVETDILEELFEYTRTCPKFRGEIRNHFLRSGRKGFMYTSYLQKKSIIHMII